MTHAYSELYLNDAQKNLANAFDYAINDCNITPDQLSAIFIFSPLCTLFETGNPGVISGRSGEELITEMILQAQPVRQMPVHTFRESRSPEYWAGWALAYYQWYSGKRFKEIFSVLPLSEILCMYPVFHEMDITNFVDALNQRFDNTTSGNTLKRIREANGLSQSELAEQSDVKLRMIQLYEQGVNDIKKAQAQTLYKLSRTLGCSMETLLS